MTPSLWTELAVVRQRVAAAEHLLVGLDYDGTLTPLVDDPADANVGSDTQELLQRLAARALTTVVIVSGRSFDDVERRVGIDGLIYAGNHGLEIRGPGIHFIEPTAARNRRALTWLAEALAKGLGHIAGAVVENKGLTISVHYRRVAPRQHDEVLNHVTAAVSVAPHSFLVNRGNQVFEIRPRIDWHKGSAMRWIVHELRIKSALTLYLGDDRTDEDAFVSLPDGITVKVGHGTPTAARYRLDGPAEVARFLDWVVRLPA